MKIKSNGLSRKYFAADGKDARDAGENVGTTVAQTSVITMAKSH
jgi:hypothetical protein